MISTIRLTGTAVLAAAALGLCAGAAQAQGTPEQRTACTPDAVRLCSDTIPDVDRTTACMRAHRSELSARCQAVFEGAPAAAPPTRVARTKPNVRTMRPEPAPHVAASKPLPTHPRVVAAVPEHPRAPRHARLRGDRDTREARRVIGGLCDARFLDASTCGFMGRVLTLAE